MTYPDGSQIHVGDLIWWDEGLCVGYVQAIAESREDYENWGLDSPHIFVSNRHPFDPSLATSGGIGYPASLLEDDGIGSLSAVERLEFERATQLALTGRSYSCYSVTTHVEDHAIKSWIFRLLDAQGCESIVPIPYESQRPSQALQRTRSGHRGCNPWLSCAGSLSLGRREDMKKEIENTIPVIPVADLKRSIQFYTVVLGFSLDWGGADGDHIGSVSRDGHCIMLSQQAEIRAPSCVWVGLESDRLFTEFAGKGVVILQKPENHPWAYDMKIQDLDGNILWLGTEPKK